MEEGIDVQTCNCIIRYDVSQTTKSHIQGNGRHEPAGVEASNSCYASDAERRALPRKQRGAAQQISFLLPGDQVFSAACHSEPDRKRWCEIARQRCKEAAQFQVARQEPPPVVEIFFAEKNDDVMVFNMVQDLNCPVVSRDGFRNWKKDLRLSKELRTWIEELSQMYAQSVCKVLGCCAGAATRRRAAMRSAKAHAASSAARFLLRSQEDQDRDQHWRPFAARRRGFPDKGTHEHGI